ncbi:hypothetical protein [Burkholderia gladioli]|uniref:hypothetical protein n=1 Tax=Burkholderia gladioli TaxID=28095 RepID=UPI0005C760C1|nr:hypothetical protein [Burkholderia gladioli]
MTKWLYGVGIVAAGYFTWCYFVPTPADRIQQTAEGCYRAVAGIGGMLHVPLPDLGDIISGQRDNARATCAGMLYGFTQGANDMARREKLEREAKNPSLYASGASAVDADSASDATGLPNAGVMPASSPAASTTTHAITHPADQAGRAVESNLPNASNPDSL